MLDKPKGLVRRPSPIAAQPTAVRAPVPTAIHSTAVLASVPTALTALNPGAREFQSRAHRSSSSHPNAHQLNGAQRDEEKLVSTSLAKTKVVPFNEDKTNSGGQ